MGKEPKNLRIIKLSLKFKSCAPKGQYCYRAGDGKLCQYYQSHEVWQNISAPYCSLLKMYGWSMEWTREEFNILNEIYSPMILKFKSDQLGDMFKECGFRPQKKRRRRNKNRLRYFKMLRR
jgi:hypothetical protein